MCDSDEDENEDWDKPVDSTLLKSASSIGLIACPLKINACCNDIDHSRVILHIDIDCFYAQVEMIRNPDLRDKPLGIQQKYIVVTCNYPARALGVTKLMLITDAKQKCPNLVLVSGEDLTNYREMSYKISNFLQKYCPLVERLGFDENFLDITGLVNDRITANTYDNQVKGHVYKEEDVTDSCRCGCHKRLMVGSQVAADIREGIHSELGITCCGGIAINKLLSKLVAGKHKPNQQTTLYPELIGNLMGELTNVRQIPGIGHTTGRRLKELDIHTVQELQNAEKKVLEEEFGTSAADNMKKLCFGIDESSVIAFGLPQTLSDEDSFKKCSSVFEVKKKLTELITSLLERLLTDGRTPQTFRLTVRKLSAEHKYLNRESRQCPLSSSLFSRFSRENVSNVCSQLETQAFNLFVKLVDIKQPFHLTLINVAFAKLEQKSSNSITNFFSPKKPKIHVENGEKMTMLQDPENDVLLQKAKNIANMERLTDEETNSDITSQETRPGINNFEPILVESGTSINVRTSCKNQRKSGLLKWFRNSIDTDIIDTETRITESQSNKRKPDGFHNDLDIKRLKSNIQTEDTGSPGESGGFIPENIDKSVFLQLPPEIQREILEESKLTSRTIGKTASVSASYTNTLHEHNGVNSKTHSDSPSFFSKLKKGNKLVSTSNCSVTKGKSADLNSYLTTVSPGGSEQRSPLINIAEEKSVDSRIPPHIDKAIFDTLPIEIQTELIEDWRRKQKSSISVKSPAPSSGSSIMAYFPKANKK